MDLLKIIQLEIDNINKYNIGSDGSKIYSDFEKEEFDYIFKFHHVYDETFTIPKFLSFCYSSIWNEISNSNIKKSLWGNKTVNELFLRTLLKRLSTIVEVYGRISKCRSKDLESVARLLASDARCGLLANFLQNATK
ncbi:MAG: hypothetical protein ACJAWV_003310 [Flammeovirgaceae bacterium]|jgi:hypothetical protein